MVDPHCVQLVGYLQAALCLVGSHHRDEMRAKVHWWSSALGHTTGVVLRTLVLELASDMAMNSAASMECDSSNQVE